MLVVPRSSGYGNPILFSNLTSLQLCSHRGFEFEEDDHSLKELFSTLTGKGIQLRHLALKAMNDESRRTLDWSFYRLTEPLARDLASIMLRRSILSEGSAVAPKYSLQVGDKGRIGESYRYYQQMQKSLSSKYL
jgi:hypothetical protein